MSDEYNHENDIPRTIAYDYLGLWYDDLKYEHYPLDEEPPTMDSVIVFRCRPASLNVAVRIRPADFGFDET